MSIARSGPIRLAVHVGVGNGNLGIGIVTKRVVLTTCPGGVDVIDPNAGGARQHKGVAAPDVLRVDVRHGNALHNYVFDVDKS